VTSHSDSPGWRGDLKFQIQPTANLDLTAHISRQNRKMDSEALISALFLEAVTFSNRPAPDIEELSNIATFWERDDQRIDVQFNRRFAKYWGIRGGFDRLERESVIEADLAEIVIPGRQDGRLERKIDRYNLGGYYRHGKIQADLLWQSEEGDRSILRTDFLDRESIKFKFDVKLAPKLHLRANCKRADYDNLSADTGFEGTETQYNLSLDVVQQKGLNLHLNYGAFNLKRNINVIYPQDFSEVPLFHRENGDSYEGNFIWSFKRFDFAVDLARYQNTGALPYNMEWGRARMEYAVSKNFHTILQTGVRRYRETDLPLADYRAESYAFFVRWAN
jgi:hypothetical protein